MKSVQRASPSRQGNNNVSRGSTPSEDSETAMLAWFPSNGSDRPQLSSLEPFSETDLRSISDILRRSGMEQWSRIPRIYSILRLVNQLPAIELFLAQGITDVWFPFDRNTVPSTLSPSATYEFLEAQYLVLSRTLDLERETGRHGHFSNPTDIPFIKVAELGKGGYGYVDKVVSTISYKEYARKLIPRGRTFKKDKQVLKDFERELGHLKKLTHLHIVKFIGSYTDPRFVSIIMSPVADCNLKEFLEIESIGGAERFSERRSFLRTFFGCLTSALCYLHENCVRHKDIKPQNVLVKGHEVFLTDFGISFDWTDTGKSTTSGDIVRTPRYCAPEVANCLPRNSSSDMWSLGCVFLEIWTVLKEETLLRLYTHLESSGSMSSYYHLNSSGISSWLSMLSSRGLNSDNTPRSWISNLMKEDRNVRWTARTLLEDIAEVNSDPETKFAFSGLCCIEDLESAESVHSWASAIDLPQLLDPVSLQRPTDNVQPESALASERPPEPLVSTSLGMPLSSSSDNAQSSTDVSTSQTIRPLSKQPHLEHPSENHPRSTLPSKQQAHKQLDQEEIAQVNSSSLSNPSEITPQNQRILQSSTPRSPENSLRSHFSEHFVQPADQDVGEVLPPKGQEYEIPMHASPPDNQVEHSTLFTKAPMPQDTSEGNISKHVIEMKDEQPSASMNKPYLEAMADIVKTRTLRRLRKTVDLAYKSPSKSEQPQTPDAATERSQRLSAQFPLNRIQRILLPQPKASASTQREVIELNTHTASPLPLDLASSPSWTDREGNHGSSFNRIQQDNQSSSSTQPKPVNPAERTSVIVEQNPVGTVKLPSPSIQRKPVGFVEKPSPQAQQKPVSILSRGKFCGKCGELLTGQFVCALGDTFHLQCFTCIDCGKMVANKFFPYENEGSNTQQALCETDYFRRLDLLCFKCGGAVHGTYITALDRKYHVDHFGCSVCNNLFGEQESYYEHDNNVYCLYHYVTQWAQLCHGCETPILKQFVEIFRNGANQHWHPECYMIYKYWNIRIAAKSMKSREIDFTKRVFLNSTGSDIDEAEIQQWIQKVDKKVSWIWQVSSAFEELCATDISDMLLHASNSDYGDVTLAASRFIAKVDILFSRIDSMRQLKAVQGNWKDPSALRESKLLCKKIVNIFQLCIRPASTGSERLGVTQELLSVITGCAHYMKLLIRIGLSVSLELEDGGASEALTMFLKSLARAKESIVLCLPSIPLQGLISRRADTCVACSIQVDDDCYRLDQEFWHRGCFRCTYCGDVFDDGKGAYGRESCRSCGQSSDAIFSSTLQQYSHLLHVALARFHATVCPNKSLSDIFKEPMPPDLLSLPGH